MADVPAIRITAVDQASAVIGQVGRSLGGFAAQVASLAAVVDSMRRALNLGDDLKRMADTTGLAIGKLDQLTIIAGQNNASLDDLARGFKFLGSSMVEAQSQSTQAAKVFAALGIATKDAFGNLRGVDDVMADAAKALESIENETLRAAAGTAIFGKSYQQIAATLRNYQKDQEAANLILEKFGGVSTTAANLADELGDKFTLLGEGSKRALLGGMVPGMAAVVAGLNTMLEAGGRFQSGFGQVVSWIAEKATVAFINLSDLMQKVGISIAAVAAAIATRSLEPFRAATEEIEKLEARRQAALAAISTAAKFPGLDDSDQVSRAAEAHDRLNKARANAAALAGALAPAEKKVAEAYESIVRALELQVAKESEHANREKVLIEFANAYGGALTRQQAIMKAYALALADTLDEQKALEESTKRAVEADKEGFEWMEKIRKSYDDSVKAVQDYVAEVEFEAQALTLTNHEREIAIALRKLEKEGIKLTAGELEQYRVRLLAALDKKEALEQQIQLWGDIESAAHDAFTHIWEGGKSVFDRLVESLKHGLLELLYQMTVKKWIIQIGAELTGNAGLLGGASSLASGGNLLAGIGKLFGFGGGAATSWATGAGESLGGGLGAAFGMSEGAGLAGLFSGAGALLPIAGIGALLYSAFGQSRGGPKEGGSAGYGAFYPGELTSAGNQQMAAVLAATQASYDKLIAALGGRGSAAFSFGYDTDPRGSASPRVSAGAMVGGRSVYSLRDLDTSDVAAAIDLEAKRALLAALQASDLPADVAKVLDSIVASTADAAAIDNVLGMAEAWGTLTDTLNANPLDDALAAIALESEGAFGALTQSAAALRDLLDIYDGTLAATQGLVGATQAYYQAQVALIGQIERTKTAIGEMFGDTIRSLTLQTLDKGGQYSYLQAEAERLRSSLDTTSDPAQIRAIADKINADIQAAFGLLDPEQQRAMLGIFTGNIEALNAQVNERLTAIETDVQTSAADVLAEIRDAIREAANVQQSAADKQESAAETNLRAANTPLNIIITDGAVGGTVGGG